MRFEHRKSACAAYIGLENSCAPSATWRTYFGALWERSSAISLSCAALDRTYRAERDSGNRGRTEIRNLTLTCHFCYTLLHFSCVQVGGLCFTIFSY